jgi:hypothetical protein
MDSACPWRCRDDHLLRVWSARLGEYPSPVIPKTACAAVISGSFCSTRSGWSAKWVHGLTARRRRRSVGPVGRKGTPSQYLHGLRKSTSEKVSWGLRPGTAVIHAVAIGPSRLSSRVTSRIGACRAKSDFILSASPRQTNYREAHQALHRMSLFLADLFERVHGYVPGHAGRHARWGVSGVGEEEARRTLSLRGACVWKVVMGGARCKGLRSTGSRFRARLWKWAGWLGPMPRPQEGP